MSEGTVYLYLNPMETPMPNVTKIIEALRERGEDSLADDIAAEFGEAAAATPQEAVADLENLEDFVLSLRIKPEDKKVIESSFTGLKAYIQRMAE